jgi:hypothetical protein
MYGSRPRQNYRPAAAKQDWTPGQTVKVGFLSLVVVEKVSTPGNWLPDQYALKNTAGVFYRFIPHNGLTRCDSLEQALEAA